MALEIRELLIRVTVQEAASLPAAGNPPLAATTTDLRQLRAELTQTCVRQVLAELQRRRER